jgi:hypothetical protein
MRIAVCLFTTLLAAFSANAVARYSEQWLSNADLPQIKPKALKKSHAEAASKQRQAKAHAGATTSQNEDPIGAFARSTPQRH